MLFASDFDLWFVFVLFGFCLSSQRGRNTVGRLFKQSLAVIQNRAPNNPKFSWIFFLNIYFYEQCQEGRKLTVEGHLFNKTTVLQRIRKAHCLRKTAVWVRPRVNSRPSVVYGLVEVDGQEYSLHFSLQTQPVRSLLAHQQQKGQLTNRWVKNVQRMEKN